MAAATPIMAADSTFWATSEADALQQMFNPYAEAVSNEPEVSDSANAGGCGGNDFISGQPDAAALASMWGCGAAAFSDQPDAAALAAFSLQQDAAALAGMAPWSCGTAGFSSQPDAAAMASMASSWSCGSPACGGMQGWAGFDSGSGDWGPCGAWSGCSGFGKGGCWGAMPMMPPWMLSKGSCKGLGKGWRTNVGGGGGAFGRLPAGGKPGDWICVVCSSVNYSNRDKCNACGHPRGNAKRLGMKAGDWVCSTCGDLVFATKSACSMCGTPKSADAGFGAAAGVSEGARPSPY